jgi:hypothetical protein
MRWVSGDIAARENRRVKFGARTWGGGGGACVDAKI